MAEKSYIPKHLYVPTIEEMIPDDIHYLSEDMLYCDKTDRQAYIHKKEELDKDTIKPRRLLGRFGLMRVMSTDESGNLIDGYVADLRLIRSPIEPMDLENEMPDDCETAASWMEEKPHYVALLAITTKDKKKKPVFSGDLRFKPQMDYLTNVTDALAKRNEAAEKRNEMKIEKNKAKTVSTKSKRKNTKKSSSKNNKK